MKFNFTGVIKRPKKFELQNVGTGEWRGLKFQAILDCGEFGNHYMTFFGGDFKKIKRVNGKNELAFIDKKIKVGDRQDPKEITISYDERFNKEIVNQLPNYRKKTFSMLAQEQVDYVFETDFINDMFANMGVLEGKRFNVTGDFFINPDTEKGINYKELRISSLKEVEDNEEHPQKAEIMGKLIYNASSIDASFFDGNGNLSSETISQFENKIPVNVFLEMQVQNKALKEQNPTCLIPMETKIDVSSVDFNDLDDVNLLTTMTSLFREVPASDMMEWDFISDLYNKQEVVELSAEDIEATLTPQERMMAMLAKKRMEKRGLGGEKRFDLDKVALKKQNKQMYGDRIQDMILVVPNGMPEKSTKFSPDMLELYKILFKKQAKVNKKGGHGSSDVDRLEAATQKTVVSKPTTIATPAPIQATIAEPATVEKTIVNEVAKPTIAGNPAFQQLFGAKK